MASGPTWNPKRKSWYVQYWVGDRWRRETVAKGPRGWRDGDARPPMPPEALAAKDRLAALEEKIRASRTAGVPSSLEAFLYEHLGRYTKDSTRESVKQTMDDFLAFCRRHGVVDRVQVDWQFCERWINDLAKRYAINTVTRKRAQVAAAWGIRKKAHRIDANPWEGVEPKGKAITKERGAWTRKQFDLIHAAAPDWLKDVLTLGVNTGLRIEALIRLEWRDILPPETDDQKYGFVRVRVELDKAGKGYKVPISRDLHAMLERRRRESDGRDAFVVMAARGAPIYHRNVTGTAIKRICAKLDLAVPHSPNHHMRRTFGRWAHFGHLTGKKVPLYTVSRWLGHSNTKTTFIYLDLEEEDSAGFMVPD